jgi:hypothetical protein
MTVATAIYGFGPGAREVFPYVPYGKVTLFYAQNWLRLTLNTDSLIPSYEYLTITPSPHHTLSFPICSAISQNWY